MSLKWFWSAFAAFLALDALTVLLWLILGNGVAVALHRACVSAIIAPALVPIAFLRARAQSGTNGASAPLLPPRMYFIMCGASCAAVVVACITEVVKRYGA